MGYVIITYGISGEVDVLRCFCFENKDDKWGKGNFVGLIVTILGYWRYRHVPML